MNQVSLWSVFLHPFSLSYPSSRYLLSDLNAVADNSYLSCSPHEAKPQDEASQCTACEGLWWFPNLHFTQDDILKMTSNYKLNIS